MPDSLSVVDPTLQPELTIRLGDSMVSSAADTLAPSSVPMQSLPMLSVDLRDALTDEAGPSSGVRPDLEVRGVIGEGGTGRVLAVCAVSMLRWTVLISLLFGVTGALCVLFPAVSMWLFSGTTVITMALATVTSWVVQRSLVAGRSA
ncbi:MAG: hypothetical protein Q8N23_28610 [Archangium sp.]|nr:hypothetical protein [Archangium sp.]MDP3570609.1 hypothetical protein [Archangium sp.]